MGLGSSLTFIPETLAEQPGFRMWRPELGRPDGQEEGLPGGPRRASRRGTPGVRRGGPPGEAEHTKRKTGGPGEVGATTRLHESEQREF